MARDDYYASPFGATYSAYMERPRLSRLIARVVWGGDTKHYYDSMGAVAEVPNGGTIVDCPCGAGPALRALDPKASVSYIAADLSPAMIRRIRKRALTRGLADVEVLEADATDIPVPSASADLFLSYWGLHCFEDPAGALIEAARVLKPGGRLVGTCFVRGSESFRQRLLVRPHTGDFGPVGTEAEVLQWLEAAGFESLDAQRSGPMLLFDTRASRNQGQTAP
jgi:ubiquinone/menaquinone biosynthesis C-methylase UbiE